ncbi:MAG: MFS transporter, partial [Chthoniobacteraceae bacterium]
AEAARRAQGGAPELASAIFKLPVVWMLCLLYFCTMMGLYGLSFWLPQIIKRLGWSGPLRIGLISAIPWFVAVVFMLAWGRNSDRHQERRLHAGGAALIAAAGFIVCGVMSHHWSGLVAISVAAAGVMGMMAVQWAMPSALLNGAAAAAGIAMVNSFGNLGGFVSPILIGQIITRTGNHAAGQYVTGGFLLLAGVLLFSLRFLEPPAGAAPGGQIPGAGR